MNDRYRQAAGLEKNLKRVTRDLQAGRGIIRGRNGHVDVFVVLRDIV